MGMTSDTMNRASYHGASATAIPKPDSLTTAAGLGIYVCINDGFRDNFMPLYAEGNTVRYYHGERPYSLDPHSESFYVADNPAALDNNTKEKDGSYATFSGGVVHIPAGMREANADEVKALCDIVDPKPLQQSSGFTRSTPAAMAPP